MSAPGDEAPRRSVAEMEAEFRRGTRSTYSGPIGALEEAGAAIGGAIETLSSSIAKDYEKRGTVLDPGPARLPLPDIADSLRPPPGLLEEIRAEQREMVRPYLGGESSMPITIGGPPGGASTLERAREPFFIRPRIDEVLKQPLLNPILDGRMDSGGGVGEFGATATAVLDDLLYIGVRGLRALTEEIHRRNVEAGWWTDPATGQRKDRNVGEMLCLVHSEISEAMEGHRKNRMDDHLPHRPMIEVELADALVRIFDIAGGLKLDLAGAFAEKVAYNATRPDHKIEARQKPGGKAY